MKRHGPNLGTHVPQHSVPTRRSPVHGANVDLPDTEAGEENRKRKFSRRMGGVHRGRELTECGEVHIGGQWGKEGQEAQGGGNGKGPFWDKGNL